MPVDTLTQLLHQYIARQYTQSEKVRQFRTAVDAAPHLTRRRTETELKSHISETLLDKAFGGQPANPSREDVIERVNEVFSKDAYSWRTFQNGHSAFVSELEALLTIREHVAIVGPKGCGKTLLVNKWLNDRTREFLEAQLHANWFRIDVTKIYSDRRPSLGEDGTRPFDMTNYFLVHAAYVFLEYSGLARNPASPKHGTSRFMEDMFDLLSALTEEELTVWESSISTIGRYYQENRSFFEPYPSERAVRFAFERGNEKVLEGFLFVAKIVGLLSQAEKICTIAIIDGIDNVSWSHRESKYNRMCDDARRFISSSKDLGFGASVKILLVARPETIPEINIRIVGSNHGKGQLPKDQAVFISVDAPIPKPDIVIARKLYAATNSPVFDVERSRCIESIGLSDFDEIMQGHLKYSSDISDILAREINELLRGVADSPASFFINCVSSSVLHVLFNYDVRSFIHAYRSANLNRLSQRHRGISHPESPSRLPQFLLVGAGPYKISTPASPEHRRGTEHDVVDVFPNIFWFETGLLPIHTRRWHGLCGLRLLQWLHARSCVAADAVYVLGQLFRYEDSILVDTLETFVSTGLLNVVYSKGSRTPELCPEDRQLAYSYQNVVMTSEKGRLMSTLSLVYFPWKYFLALDTPIIDRFVPPVDSRHMVFYVNAADQAEGALHFSESAVPTVATFLRQVYTDHIQDCESFRRLSDDAYAIARKLNLDGDNFLEFFSFPKAWEEKRREMFRSVLSAREREDRRAFNSFENSLIGILR